MRALAAVALAALALTGCETTAEKSAKLERAAKQLAAHGQSEARALTVTRPSIYVKVLAATLVRGAHGAAAVVELRNESARALRTVPIAITAENAAGKTTYENNEAGLQAALVSVGSLAPHTTLSWVNDQVTAAGGAKLAARVGEAESATRDALPTMAVSSLHLSEASGAGVEAEGKVANASGVAQHNLVVFITAVNGAHVVAAARAVLSELPARSTQSFSASLTGDPRGARLQASAPATTFG